MSKLATTEAGVEASWACRTVCIKKEHDMKSGFTRQERFRVMITRYLWVGVCYLKKTRQPRVYRCSLFSSYGGIQHTFTVYAPTLLASYRR